MDGKEFLNELLQIPRFPRGRARLTENRYVSKLFKTHLYQSRRNFVAVHPSSMDGIMHIGDGTAAATAYQLDTAAADLVCMEDMPAWEYELDGTDGVLDGLWGVALIIDR